MLWRTFIRALYSSVLAPVPRDRDCIDRGEVVSPASNLLLALNHRISPCVNSRAVEKVKPLICVKRDRSVSYANEEVLQPTGVGRLAWV